MVEKRGIFFVDRMDGRVEDVRFAGRGVTVEDSFGQAHRHRGGES